MSNSNFLTSGLCDPVAVSVRINLKSVGSRLNSYGTLVIIITYVVSLPFPSISMPLSIELCSEITRSSCYSFPSLVSSASS